LVTDGAGLEQSISSRLRDVPPDRLLVVSDFDGTIAEIVPSSGDARPITEAAQALDALADSVLVVVILSGRSRGDLAGRLPNPKLRLLGDYGLEEPDDGERQALAGFNQQASVVVDRHPGAQLEMKRGSTSIHYRAAPELADELLKDLAPLAARAGLEARRGRMVVEVRPRRAEKGAAMQRLLDELQPAGAVFAGDDEGDRRVFELLMGSRLPHLAVGVASQETDARLFDACDLVVPGPAGAAAFFSRLAGWARRGRAGPGSAG
jgi:trehalose 6-phosphate phosphatase